MASKRPALAAGERHSLAAVRGQFAAASPAASPNDLVTVQNWSVSYGSNGLTETCTVTANKSGDSITSVGLLAYSADGATFYCSQITEDTGGNSVSPSMTTGGFNIQPGAQVLGVVFGYVEGVKFFFERVLPVNGSPPPPAKEGGVKATTTSAPRSGKKPGSTKRGQRP